MPEKILIVDDEKDFRDELKELLDGYSVVEASGGREALEILKRANEISLVILDVMMPGLSGTEVLKEIRKIDHNLGIIILTGYGSKDVAVEALKARADDFIEKPLDVNKIADIVEKVLGAKKSDDGADNNDTKSKIEKVKRFIERNCYKKTCLNDAAKTVCLSPKYLSRVFRQQVGVNFSKYRLKIKTEKAEELLVETRCNVNQVSEKLSYKNVESFIRQFKKFTGYTPTKYRKNKSR